MEIKKGKGSESNSASWRAAYIKNSGGYYAMLNFSSAAGHWKSIYRITEEAFNKLGTFEDDDYKTEELIRKGECVYRFENERNSIEPVELVYDDNWKKRKKHF